MMHFAAPHLRPPRLCLGTSMALPVQTTQHRRWVTIMLAASLTACRVGQTCSCGYGYEGRTQAGHRAACGMRAARVQGAEA